MEQNTQTQLVYAQELTSRFRSKEDLHRYLTQQGNLTSLLSVLILVGVFLPSISRTPLDFLREILKEEKLHLK